MLTLAFSFPLGLTSMLILSIDLGTELAPGLFWFHVFLFHNLLFFFACKITAISLAYEEKESDVMAQPPRNVAKDRLVSAPLLLYAYLEVLLFFVFVFCFSSSSFRFILIVLTWICFVFLHSRIGWHLWKFDLRICLADGVLQQRCTVERVALVLRNSGNDIYTVFSFILNDNDLGIVESERNGDSLVHVACEQPSARHQRSNADLDCNGSSIRLLFDTRSFSTLAYLVNYYRLSFSFFVLSLTNRFFLFST